MMVGHLQVPVIEPIGGLPSSLSRNVVYDLLTDELAFKGLIFTDALAMRGVSGNGNVSLQALQAGNDMVLAPRNLKAEVPAVLAAVEKGELSREDIAVSYTHLRAHETGRNLVCRLLLEKKKKKK